MFFAKKYAQDSVYICDVSKSVRFLQQINIRIKRTFMRFFKMNVMSTIVVHFHDGMLKSIQYIPQIFNQCEFAFISTFICISVFEQYLYLIVGM